MTETEMVQQLVAAAEAGYPGDRAAQIRNVSAMATKLPWSFNGVFLEALKILAERGVAET